MMIFDAHRHLNTLRSAGLDELEARAYVRVLGKVLQEQEELREREEERRLEGEVGGAIAVVETQKHAGELCEAGVTEAYARTYLGVLREMLQEREEERRRLVEEYIEEKKTRASDIQRETTTSPNAT